MDMQNIYDIVIIGGGPAGLAAALYAGRARMKTLLIEKAKYGGQIAITNEIENYPGAVEEESGPSLMKKFEEQVIKFGADRVFDTIVDVELEGKIKHLKGNNGDYYSKTVIIAAGASPRPIGCPGEKEFTGKGVSYCATCDANFFEDFEVFVVGGGDSAVEEAMYLTKFARKVTLIHRRDTLRAAQSIQEKAFKNPKMNFMWNSAVEEIKGENCVTSMVIRNTVTGELTTVEADEDDGLFGIFVFIGFDPKSELFEGKVAMENRYILADADMKTNVPGVFAAGDIIKKSLRQVVTAAADGAIAATSAQKYIEEHFED